jgi:hypothetical protein
VIAIFKNKHNQLKTTHFLMMTQLNRTLNLSTLSKAIKETTRKEISFNFFFSLTYKFIIKIMNERVFIMKKKVYIFQINQILHEQKYKQTIAREK